MEQPGIESRSGALRTREQEENREAAQRSIELQFECVKLYAKLNNTPVSDVASMWTEDTKTSPSALFETFYKAKDVISLSPTNEEDLLSIISKVAPEN